jgi:hypothetical protein
VFFGLGFLAELAMGGTVMQALQFGTSILLWGVFVRTVFVWHQTWAVNSVTHLWGYRNYKTDEDSRNNVFVGLLAHGEGWHNNHHADPRSAKHGHKWWEFDTTWLTIRLFEKLGLATDIIGPSPYVMAKAGTAKARPLQRMVPTARQFTRLGLTCPDQKIKSPPRTISERAFCDPKVSAYCCGTFAVFTTPDHLLISASTNLVKSAPVSLPGSTP